MQQLYRKYPQKCRHFADTFFDKPYFAEKTQNSYKIEFAKFIEKNSYQNKKQKNHKSSYQNEFQKLTNVKIETICL